MKTEGGLSLKIYKLAEIIFFKTPVNNEHLTFRYHFWFSVLDGIIVGVFTLNEFVLLKALKADNIQIGYLFQFGAMVLLFSSVFNEFLKRSTNKRKTVLKAAVITRSPLLLLALFPPEINPEMSYLIPIFLGVFFMFNLSNPLIMPIINEVLKQNYSHQNYGTYYGYATTIAKIFTLVVTFATGLLFDFQASAYRFVYPSLAFVGVASVYFLMKIPYQAELRTIPNPPIIKSIKQSFIRMFLILKHNRPYLDFQIGFMLYGFAWLSGITVIALFFEKVLHLGYSEIAFYRNFYTTVSILLTPYLGKMLGRIDPRQFGIYTFGAMALYLFFVFLTDFIRLKSEIFGLEIYWMLLIGNIFYGLFGALMGLLWYIGSAYFAKSNEIADYQAVHLTLTGMRGAIAPILGVWMLQFIDYQGVLMFGIVSLLLAVLVQYKSYKHRKMLSTT